MGKTRIGIVTFHRAVNYGAVLQAYALQKSVEKLGINCDIIDYRNKKLEESYHEHSLRKCRTPKDFAKFFLRPKTKQPKYKKFQAFRETHLSLSAPCSTAEELSKLADGYDSFIVGSDQVWNYNITGFDSSYFLDFVEDQKKRNAYAASFGIDTIPLEYQEQYKNYLDGLNYIAVRERQGQKIIKDLTGRDVEIVLDPVLLLSEKEWSQISANPIEMPKGDYILSHHYSRTPTMNAFLERLSKKTGCKILSVFRGSRDPMNAITADDPGPLEFIKLYKDARYVVTNSYHGAIFAIIFQKNFFLEMLPPPAKVNSRLRMLLDLFDLGSREIIDGENFHINEPIKYEKVLEILSQERERSINYLKRIVEN